MIAAHEHWVVVFVLCGERRECPVSCKEEARRAVELLQREGLSAFKELRSARHGQAQGLLGERSL